MLTLNLSRVITDLWKQGYFNIENQPLGSSLAPLAASTYYQVGDPIVRSQTGDTKGQFVLATDVTAFGEFKVLVIRKDKFADNDFQPTALETNALQSQNQQGWDWISPKTHFAIERRIKDDIFVVGDPVFIGDNGAYVKTGTNQIGFVERVGTDIKEGSANVPSFIMVRYQPNVIAAGGAKKW